MTAAEAWPWPRRDCWPPRETPRSRYAARAYPSPRQVRGRAPSIPSARVRSSLFSPSSFPDRPSLSFGRQASRSGPARRRGALASGRSASYTAVPLTRHDRHRHKRKRPMGPKLVYYLLYEPEDNGILWIKFNRLEMVLGEPGDRVTELVS